MDKKRTYLYKQPVAKGYFDLKNIKQDDFIKDY